ncbi:MAG: DegT/DnrJ/EryC1/StrS family aminotransferase [Eubacterium sp.]|jgi:dTDP-4-amino-4,6-dideoxygalactose transaminase|nr:DegT/DnrJ/EryC1/StrS family aminotransferase [Eubacterium sp.]NBI84987.1 DegT/DnrJ/EryC1/StrS family aminotransferase [Lachnospiraceae bacterium]
MEVKILDLARQYELIQDEVEKAVCEQMKSGMYIGGKAVADFEQEFAKYIGVKHAISVNSGTDSLVIALKALGIKPGDEVITTPFTFFATAETIAMVGAVPVFVDVKEDTYNIDPDKIEEKITDKTKAILPVHIFGQPADMEQISQIAKKHGLVVIEDACQAVGAAISGKKAGSFADAGCFSFFPTKNLGAFGDAGMITTNDDSVATICRAFKEHGMAQNGAKARYILEGVEDELEGTASPDALYNPYKYYNYLIAYNSRMDAIQARVLGIKLKHLNEFNAKRAAIAAFYNEAFSGCSGITTPIVKEGYTPVWHQYAFRCTQKDEMGNFLASKGVGSAAFYPVPLHLQKAFTYLGYKEGDLPVAEMLTKQTVCLPIFPELTKEELMYVTENVKAFFAG